MSQTETALDLIGRRVQFTRDIPANLEPRGTYLARRGDLATVTAPHRNPRSPLKWWVMTDSLGSFPVAADEVEEIG